MQRGIAAALMALACATGSAALAQDNPGDDLHRLYDRQTDCAVFDTQAFPADEANWDGPCTRGLASGRGTATCYGRNGTSETLSAEFRDGIVVDGKVEINWSDGAHYAGLAADGKPDGQGVLIDAKGNRFDGEWKTGSLNGHGAVSWANGDRYEGDWVAGKAEGHGVQVWADGQKYDGAWRNDQPNGQGTLTRKDGTSVAGLFVDGKRQAPAGETASLAPVPTAATATTTQTPLPVASATTNPGDFLDGFAGRTLFAVDGSSVVFSRSGESLLRVMTAPDGAVQKAQFTVLAKGLGTVTDAGDPPTVRGVFRATPAGIEADYADGQSEMLAPVSDGLSIVLRNASGDKACSAWYPQGHVFGADERKAAVAAYARRLGVSDPAPAPGPSCAQAAPASVADHRVSAPVASHKRSSHAPAQASALPAPATPVSTGVLPTLSVKASTVHLIDAPSDDALGTVASSTASSAPGDEAIASNCLKVDSDGSYWGFRNHCGYAVQFAYCLLDGTSEMTACGANGVVSVPGSVPANGFGALFADDSLGERDVRHDFRWVGCKGGAGEVAAHLDAIDPASGHCLRAGRTLARTN